MKSYIDILKYIMFNGVEKDDRTNTGTRAIFGYQWRHNMQEGFPLLTTKRVPLRWIAVELMWFLNGRTDHQFLLDHGVDIWKEWVKEDGTLGPVYGWQWRHFGADEETVNSYPGVDQIAKMIKTIKNNPDSRRMIVSAWNPEDVDQMALPPCHTLFQCAVIQGKLSLHLYARSIDTFLGLPFNIASYALLLKILANVCDVGEGELIISFGDLHIYKNHFNQVYEQIGRTPYELPKVLLTRKLSAPEGFTWHDVRVENYNSHPKISAPVAV